MFNTRRTTGARPLIEARARSVSRARIFDIDTGIPTVDVRPTRFLAKIRGATSMRRRALGTMALVTALAPWLATATVSIHLLADSDHAAEHGAARDLEDALHGHRHEAATPHHQHVVILPAAQSLAARASYVVIAEATPAPTPPASPVPVMSQAFRCQHEGLGPTPGARSIVILRI